MKVDREKTVRFLVSPLRVTCSHDVCIAEPLISGLCLQDAVRAELAQVDATVRENIQVSVPNHVYTICDDALPGLRAKSDTIVTHALHVH